MKKLFNFDMFVLDGCIHHCDGCNVKKENGRSLTIEEVLKLDSFLNEIEDKGYILNEILFSPVDVFSAENLEETLKLSERIINRFRYFKTGAILTYKESFILSKLCLLDQYVKSPSMTLTTPLKYTSLHKPQYLEIIRKNSDLIKAHYGDRLWGILYRGNVDFKGVPDENPFKRLSEMNLGEGFLNLDLTEGNLDIKDLNNKIVFKEKFNHFKSIIEKHMPYGIEDTDLMKDLDFYDEDKLDNLIGERKDLLDTEYLRLIYQKGYLYHPFIYNDAFFVNHESYSVPFTGSLSDVEELETKLFMEQTLRINEQCSACKNNPYCYRTLNLLTKDIIKQEGCMLPKPVFDTLNNIINQ